MSSIEDQLTRELGAVAGAEAAPHVDVPGVRRVAGRERRRRAGLVALAAAAAITVGSAGLRPHGGGAADGRPAADVALPVGGPLRLPWVAAGDALHLPDGRVLTLPDLATVASRGGTTIVGTAEQGDDLTFSRVDTAGAELLLGTLRDTPRISTDGRWVSWNDRVRVDGRPGWRVWLLDVGSGRKQQVDLTLPQDAGPTSLTVESVGSGRVLLETGSGDRLLWSPGAAPVGGLDLPALGSADLLPGDRLALHVDGPEPSAGTLLYDVVDDHVRPDGELVGESRDPVWDPGGTAYVSVVGDDLAFVTTQPDGSGVVGAALTLPGRGVDWAIAGWEDDDDVVLAGGPGVRLVRCQVSTSSCERVRSDGIRSLVGYE